MGILRPEELSKMFPTPPSLEHNPIASPIGTHDLPPPDMTELSIIRVKQDIYPNMGSPQEENIGKFCRRYIRNDSPSLYQRFNYLYIFRGLELRI